MLRVELYILGQIDYQAKVLQCILIDRSNRVINEYAGGQDCEGKDFYVVILVFVEGSDSFGVDDEDVYFLAVGRSTF